MPGFSFGHPGGYLTANNRFAQLLGAQQSFNNGTAAGGLADALRLGLMGYALGKDQRDATAADEAFTRGMSAKPWVNPDTGSQTIARDMPPGMAGGASMIGDEPGLAASQMVPTASAGGMEGAMSALRGMSGNPHAGRYARQLMMMQVDQDLAAQQDARAHRNALALKAAPGYQPPPKPTSDMQNYEFARQNGFTGSFDEWVAIGASNKTPANVQEWQFYSQLSPEQKEQFLTMKRANPWRDMGATQALPSQVNPAGPPLAEMPNTVPPEQTPELRGAQAAAQERAKAGVAVDAEVEKKARDAQRTIALIDEAIPLIEQSTSGLMGTGVDTVAGAFGHPTEGARAIGQLKVIQAQLMLNMPRMEGPQSDKDTQLYREAAAQIADSTVPREIRIAAAQMIKALQMKYASPQVPQTAGLPDGVSEADIQETMRANNMTREQVLQRLRESR